MPFLPLPCAGVLAVLPNLWQGLTDSIAKLEAHGTSPKTGVWCPCAVSPASVRSLPPSIPSVYHLPPAPAGGGRGPPRPMQGAGADKHQPRRKGTGEGHEEAGGKRTSGEPAHGSRTAKAGNPPAPCLLGSPAGAAGGEAVHAKNQYTERGEGDSRAVSRAGEKAAKGATGRAPPTGAGRHAGPAVRHFFRIPWRVWAPPPRIAARGPKRGADEGHTGTRPRGPAGPRQATPPSARLRAVVQGCERRRAAHGTPPGYQPQTRRLAPPTRSQTLTGLSARGAVWSVAEFGPNGTGQAHARAYWAGEGRGLRRMGARGEHPRERAGPSRPEGASEGARAILPLRTYVRPLYLILGHYYFTTL